MDEISGSSPLPQNYFRFPTTPESQERAHDNTTVPQTLYTGIGSTLALPLPPATHCHALTVQTWTRQGQFTFFPPPFFFFLLFFFSLTAMPTESVPRTTV